MPEPGEHKEKAHWLDRPVNVNRIIYGLFTACVLFGLLDIVLPRKSAFAFESWPGFYAWFGFAACVGLVMAAKLLRHLLMRPEDYYD